MDDMNIEELLRQSIKLEEPDGMRERVLRSARMHLVRKPRWRALLGWKPALAIVALLLLTLTSLDEHARSVRLSAIIGDKAGITVYSQCDANFYGYRRYVMAMNDAVDFNNWTFESLEAKFDDPCSN
ncbi:MAG: hypothetical protein ACYC1M_09335 [Armatimonadota bacterium]